MCVCVFECLTLHAWMRLTFHRVCGCVEEREGPLAAGRGLVLRAPPAGQLELGPWLGAHLKITLTLENLL